MKVMTTFILGVFFTCTVMAQEINTYITSTEILMGQPDTLVVQVSSVQASVSLPEFQDTITSQLEIYYTTKWDTSIVENSVSYTKQIVFSCFDTGFVVVPPLQINGQDTSYYSRAHLLHVRGEEVNIQDNIRDIKGQKGSPITVLEVLFVVLILLLLLAVLYLVRSFYVNHKLIKDVLPIVEPEIPFMDVFWSELDRLKDEEVWRADPKKYQSEVSDLLRGYLAYRYDFNAKESTTRDLIQRLRTLVPESVLIEKIGLILNFSDLVKFAKAKGVEDQYKNVISNIKEVVLKTQITVIDESSGASVNSGKYEGKVSEN